MNAPLPSGYFLGRLQDEPDAPRFRAVGDLTLDLFNHDGRVDAEWLGLSLAEFALLWRLAAAPGKRLTGPELRADSKRAGLDGGGDGVAAHMAKARAKLVAAGLPHLLRSDPEDGHFIDLPPPASGLAPFAAD